MLNTLPIQVMAEVTIELFNHEWEEGVYINLYMWPKLMNPRSSKFTVKNNAFYHVQQ